MRTRTSLASLAALCLALTLAPWTRIGAQRGRRAAPEPPPAEAETVPQGPIPEPLPAPTTADAEPTIPTTPTSFPETPQSFVGPGMYIFQTRTRLATCGDDERTGYVDSFIAPIHGVSGNRRMLMTLANSQWWSRWDVTIDAEGVIYGDSMLDGGSGPARPTNHFVVVRRSPARFTGIGVRSYQALVGGQSRRCQVTYDALLRRIDL